MANRKGQPKPLSVCSGFESYLIVAIVWNVILGDKVVIRSDRAGPGRAVHPRPLPPKREAHWGQWSRVINGFGGNLCPSAIRVARTWVECQLGYGFLERNCCVHLF